MNTTVVQILIWGGAAITLVGLALLMICILRVTKAKRSGASDDALSAVLQSVVPLNLGGLCLSALGLILVVTGLFLG